MQHSDRLLGESAAFLEALEAVSRVAPLNKPVLIIGERGTGKEVAASRVHFLSDRWGQPYLTLNCATISESLMDSELFGHESGSFSGASRQHKGYFERADGGTLFLDELATVSSQVQEKLLRVIEYGEVRRLGGDKPISVDVRLVAATNDDLPALVKQGRFRADLLDRLAFDVITLPPLRYRQEDILLLAEHFAMGMIKELGREYFPGFTERALEALHDYEWPGNVRELKNVIERAVYKSETGEPVDELVFDAFASPYRPSPSKAPLAHVNETSSEQEPAQKDIEEADYSKLLGNSDVSFKEYIENHEIEVLKSAYQKNQFNQKKTAESLGLTYHQLRAYFRKYKIK